MNATAVNKWALHTGQMLAEWEARETSEASALDLGDPADWIEANFWIPELRAPIRLMPYHKAMLREAYRTDRDGRFVYDMVVWSDIKKSAKSSIAAAVAMHRATSARWGSIKIMANDLDQAVGRVAEYFVRSLELSPHYREKRDYRRTGNKILFVGNRTTVQAIAVDPKGEAGGNDDLLIFSELWGFTTTKHERFWAEMTLSPTKYGRSQKWVETYAGYSGESVLLEGLYEDAMKHGRKLDLSFEDEEGWHDLGDLDVYAGNGMLLMWNTRPRCPWQTTAYYTSEERDQTADEFRRIHKNEWITSTAKFVPDAWWEQCREDNQPVWRHSDKITLAADAGVSGDNFALVGTTPRNGRDWVRYVKTWAPPKGGKIDFTGTKAEPGPDREIIRLWLTGQVDEVRYDPYQLHDMATRLANGFVMNGDDPFFPDPAEIRNGRWNGRPVVKVNMVEFSQAGKRAKADKQLYDKIRDQRIAQPGDPVLTQHVQSANQKAEGDKMRIIKRNAKLKVDACVALSMSSYREVDTTPAKRPAMIRGGA